MPVGDDGPAQQAPPPEFYVAGLCEAGGRVGGVDFARLSGASVAWEPSTADVLQRALTPEQCRSLFLKSPNAEQKRQMAELAEELRGLPA